MANLIRIQNQNAPGISDPYGEAQRQQDYADLITAHSLKPHYAGTGSNAQAIQMGITQLAEALLGRGLQNRAGTAADEADAQQNKSNQALVEALAPAVAKGGQTAPTVGLDSLAPTDPGVVLGGSREAVPDAINPAHGQLAAAVAGMDPRTAGGALAGAAFRNALPDPQVEAARQLREATLAQAAADRQAAREAAVAHDAQASADRRYAVDQGNETRRDLANIAASAKKSGAPDALSPDTVTNAAWDVVLDPARMRQYASFGAAGQDIRNTVNNRKSQLMKDAGISEQEVLRQQATAKAQIKSIGDLVPMRNAVSAYETVARSNGERFLELTKKVNTSGIPFINSGERLGKLATGSPDAAEMMQVLQNYQTEVARIIANPRLVGQLTDTARKEIENVIPANLTVAQAARIVNRLNFEFELRGRGLDDAIAGAQGGIGGFGQTPTPPPLGGHMTQAPPEAIAYLQAHPEFAPQFKEKYGYVPGG